MLAAIFGKMPASTRKKVLVYVEANPNLCVGLRECFARPLATGQFTLIEKAIAETSGSVEFHANASDLLGTANREFADRVAELAPAHESKQSVHKSGVYGAELQSKSLTMPGQQWVTSNVLCQQEGGADAL